MKKRDEIIDDLIGMEMNRITDLIDENIRLKCQLAEKDKEIEELKFEKRNTFGLIEKVSSKGQQEIRHNVCDEIRKKGKDIAYYEADWLVLSLERLEEIMDKIEEGE